MCVFDVELPETSAITALGDVQLVDAILATSKLDSAIQARRLSAICELWDRRKREADTECEFFLMDTDVPAENGYRPSRALAEFVRLRDLFCRFPGCDCPAAQCDIDHTIPVLPGRRTDSPVQIQMRMPWPPPAQDPLRRGERV